MATVKLSDALRRIDLLDGMEDDKYMGAPINNTATSAFVVCHGKEGVEEALGAQARVFKMQPSPALTFIDCEGLAKRLNLLADIGSKITTTRFLIKLGQGELPKADVVPSPEDMFVFRVIDIFVSRILQDEEKQKEPLSQGFAFLPVAAFVQGIQGFGRKLEGVGYSEAARTYEAFKIDGGLAGAYSLFATEAKKIGCDSTPFKPPAEKTK